MYYTELIAVCKRHEYVILHFPYKPHHRVGNGINFAGKYGGPRGMILDREGEYTVCSFKSQDVLQWLKRKGAIKV